MAEAEARLSSSHSNNAQSHERLGLETVTQTRRGAVPNWNCHPHRLLVVENGAEDQDLHAPKRMNTTVAKCKDCKTRIEHTRLRQKLIVHHHHLYLLLQQPPKHPRQ